MRGSTRPAAHGLRAVLGRLAVLIAVGLSIAAPALAAPPGTPPSCALGRIGENESLTTDVLGSVVQGGTVTVNLEWDEDTDLDGDVADTLSPVTVAVSGRPVVIGAPPEEPGDDTELTFTLPSNRRDVVIAILWTEQKLPDFPDIFSDDAPAPYVCTGEDDYPLTIRVSPDNLRTYVAQVERADRERARVERAYARWAARVRHSPRRAWRARVKEGRRLRAHDRSEKLLARIPAPVAFADVQAGLRRSASARTKAVSHAIKQLRSARHRVRGRMVIAPAAATAPRRAWSAAVTAEAAAVNVTLPAWVGR